MNRLYFLPILVLSVCLVNGCEKDVLIETQLIEPQLIVSADTLIFNEEETKLLYLSTKPATDCDFQVVSYPDWVEVSPLSGSIFSNIAEIQITSLFESNQPGIYTGELEIISTSGTNTVNLKGFVGEHVLYTLLDSIYFSVFSNKTDLIIRNEGNVAIDYVASVNNDYVSLASTSGEIAVGQQRNIEINVDRTSMVTNSYESKIFLTINDTPHTVVVRIENFKEQKLILEADIIDAEFSRTNNTLIYVSNNPMALTILNVTDKSIHHVPLSFMPTCVSVSKDGNHAIVGHDGRISYVDIINNSVLNTVDVPCYVSDIALGINNWAYAIPKNGSHVKVQCINLSDNTVLAHLGNTVYEGSKVKIHPAGKYIYLADNGVSPSDIRKLDIQKDTAIYLYDSPYHGDYPSGEDLWFSEDGIRIFTKMKSVFKTSDLQSQDMLYNGKINLESSSYGYNNIQWLDHSSIKNNLYIISTGEWYNEPNKPIAYIYNATNLVYKSKINLERYMVPDGFGSGSFYDPAPYFIFSNSSGNKIFVLTKALESGLLYEWALQEYNIE